MAQFFVFGSQALILALKLRHPVLGSSDRIDACSQLILHLLAPVTLCIIHHTAIALHGAKCTVVTPECHGEALRFAIVVGQLGILIADVLDQVLVLLCRIGKLLETLGS